MNTGWVGGAEGTPHSKKVKIRHSSAIVQGIAKQSITWKPDPTFGYELASGVDGFSEEDHNLLAPKDYYEATARGDEYENIAQSFKKECVAHLRKFPGTDERLIEAVS